MFNKKRFLPLALAFMMGLTSVPAVPTNVMAEENNSNTTQTSPSSTKPTINDSNIADQYHYVWGDEFNGDTLDTSIWNVETHERGWVNNEWQEYVNSDDNIKVVDGKLKLIPKVTSGTAGTEDATYTSGRINTQGKKDLKYGAFEIKAKVPKGKGYLPAFWMMPTNENLYGQWPRCGEIDCMEVMGQETNKLYGTIHYGNPHAQQQGEKTVESADFSTEEHIYTCEWKPGIITWYLDGEQYYTTREWHTTTEGQGTVTYPAPFDQPFYVILNLAVGGSWVGYPDETTSFDNQAFEIDYVRAYQKESYDENVTRPKKDITIKEPDINGNYITNGDFATAEDLSDNADWKFMTALGGEASASIANGEMKISTTKAGTVDYSVQLVQAGLPLEKNDTYEISFKAKADAARSTNVALKAPDLNFATYWSEDIELGTEYKEYKFTYTMNKATDGNARLEYNMGAKGSTAAIYIDDVAIKKTDDKDSNAPDAKTVRADGNYLYNGSFQEGEKRLENWIVGDGITASVTNLSDNRRLKADVSDVNATISQTDTPITKGKYALSFEAQGQENSSVDITVGGIKKTIALSSEKKTYNEIIELTEEPSNHNFVIKFGNTGTFYLDNVRLVEDTLIKNGSFNAGLAGYEFFVDGSASASYVVDSLNEKNALDVTIKNTSDQEWKIQLKQTPVELVKDKCYKLSFDAKSSIDRTIQYAIQRNGAIHNDDWTPYTQETVSLSAYGDSNEYTHITNYFQMAEETDTGAVFNIALGGGNNTTQHRVCIDNIVLEEIDPSQMPAPDIEDQAENTNLLKNADFSDTNDSFNGWTETIANWDGGPGADATRVIENSTIKYDITNVGTEDWNIQLKQSSVPIAKDTTYVASFDVTSTKARAIKTGVMSTGYVWYGGSDVVLDANKKKHVTFEFSIAKDDPAADFYISMGKIADIDTPASEITISNISLIKHTKCINLKKTDAVAATCTTAGNIDYYTCSDCGKFYSDSEAKNEIDENSWIIPATGHHTTKVDAVAPTCTTFGKKEYFKCNDCGKLFSDANATTPVDESTLVIPATGHNMTKVDAVAATCTTSGNTEYFKCNNCGKLYSDANGTNEIASNSTIINANGHSLVKVDAVAPTCTTAGNTEYFKCTACGKFYSDAAATTEIAENSWIIAATGHSYESKTVKATTTTDGYTADVCSTCNEETNKVVIKAIKSASLKSTTYVYTGKAIKPSATVKDTAGKTIDSKNYTVTYKNNKSVGKATVTITFKGNYEGKITKSFKIIPKATAISKITAKNKGLQIKWRKQATQTSGYQIQYSTSKNFKNATTITVSNNKTSSKYIKGLKSNKKYYVRIRTYKTVGKVKYTSKWSKVVSTTTKK